LPSVGDKFDAGQAFGVVESVKGVRPADAHRWRVTEVNDATVDKPESLNSDPYGSWLVKIHQRRRPTAKSSWTPTPTRSTWTPANTSEYR
jgi:glycine cleavage system H lipoate-binding protein